ncbi:MAG: flagellar basal body P-ring formation chaperone FlgA [Pseudomonadota bacterium]
MKIICGALLALAMLPVLAADMTIALRRDVTVATAIYRLDDIAGISGGGPAESSALAQMEIGVAPRPGYSKRLSQQQVARFIEAHAPHMRGKLQFSGHQNVTVRAAGVLEKQRLARTAEDFLRAALAGSYEKLEIKITGEAREVALPAGAELRARIPGGIISSRTAVWVDVQADGRAYAAIPVWFSVQTWKQVAVARTDLTAGAEVRPDDFVMALRDVARFPGAVDRLPGDGASRLRVALRQGMPLTASAVESTPTISRNQQVLVRMNTGNITIESAGVAQANGRVGEMVKVKNAGNSEIFIARVLEPGVVAVNAR